MEDGERAVGVLVDADAGFDVVGALGSGGELQDPLTVADGVVAGDDALFVQAEDVVDLVGPGQGDEGRAVEFGRDREAAVVLGQIRLGDEAVGGLDTGDAGERQTGASPRLAEDMYRAALPMPGGEYDGTATQLIGLGLSNLSLAANAEPDLLDPEARKRAGAEHAIDAVRDKLGLQAITKERSVRTPTSGNAATAKRDGS